jgi:hypothetical protein
LTERTIHHIPCGHDGLPYTAKCHYPTFYDFLDRKKCLFPQSSVNLL